MKLDQLNHFREAVKYKSISVAAERNYMSQSSISHSIINLEKELGVELLKRTNIGVVPTEMGLLVLQNAEDIFHSIDNIFEIVKEKKNFGEVMITCIPCMCDWIIPKTIQNLALKSYGMNLTVTTAESRIVAHNVLTGISEFGILINYSDLKNTDLIYTKLFCDEYMLNVGKKSPYWDEESITYKEISEQPYIAYRDEFRKDNGGLTNLIGSNPIPNIFFRTDSLDSIRSMIAQDNYVAFFPKYMSEHDSYIQNGWIRRLPISDMNFQFEVGYVESSKYKITKTSKIVLDELKRIVEKTN